MRWVKNVWRRWQSWLVAGGLLIALAASTALPAIKTLAAWEVKPENQGRVLGQGEPLANEVVMPAGQVDAFIVWVHNRPGLENLKPSDFETVRLEISAPDGSVIRTADRPKLIKREDKPALLFQFKGIQAEAGQRYKFTLIQAGAGKVTVQEPLDSHIRQDERVTLAFQLGGKKSAISLLLGKVYAESLVGKDISFYLYRGNQIVSGENPYLCATEPGSCTGYPAHLPGMYWVAAGAAALGFDELPEWAAVWRPVMLASWLGVGAVLAVFLFRRKQPALAVGALGFWLFNRWTLDVVRIAHVDFTGVLFLLLAVALAGRWPWAAALLLGVSLSVKQVAVLVVPLFLIVMWRQHVLKWWKVLGLAGLVLLVPLLVSLPFLWDNPGAVVTGWMNVAERPAQPWVHGFAPSLDKWLDVSGTGKLWPLLGLAGIVYVAAGRKEVGLIGGTLMVMGIMVALTPVLYNQYMVWFIPFIPLALAEFSRLDKAKIAE